MFPIRLCHNVVPMDPKTLSQGSGEENYRNVVGREVGVCDVEGVNNVLEDGTGECVL